jgi:hypothetical protein
MRNPDDSVILDTVDYPDFAAKVERGEQASRIFCVKIDRWRMCATVGQCSGRKRAM